MNDEKFSCVKCNKGFKRKDSQVRHKRNCKRIRPQTSGSGIPKKRRTVHNVDFYVRKTKIAFRNATIT